MLEALDFEKKSGRWNELNLEIITFIVTVSKRLTQSALSYQKKHEATRNGITCNENSKCTLKTKKKKV
jgi:hypothetical protein